MEIEVVTERLGKFILEHFPSVRKRSIRNDEQLIESGVIDSLGVLDIVEFMEREFNIAISDDELVPENFRTIDCLASFVQKKLSDGVPK
jgi:acyl carrier protein